MDYYKKYKIYKKKYLKLKSKKQGINVVSWNIGDNINQKKIQELLNQIKKENILILAFQETPVYFFDNKLKKLLEKNLPDYNLLDYSSTCNNLISAYKGFSISIFIFVNKNFDSKVTIKNKDGSCPKFTKGFVALTLSVNNLNIDIISTHMPFKSEEESLSFQNNFEEWMQNNNFTSLNRIVIGDLNSRSLLTKECYEKNVNTCQLLDSNYCKLKNLLESLSWADSVNTYELFKRPSKTNCNPTDCTLTTYQQVNLIKIISILLENDFMGNPPQCKFFNSYKEHSINFLPTYKRDKETGRFSLHKKNQGRLPGYADRIVYKGSNLKSTEYNLLPIKGNDHLPIYGVFNITLTPTI